MFTERTTRRLTVERSISLKPPVTPCSIAVIEALKRARNLRRKKDVHLKISYGTEVREWGMRATVKIDST